MRFRRLLAPLAGAVLVAATPGTAALAQESDPSLDDISSPEEVRWDLLAHDGPEEIIDVLPGTSADLVLQSGRASFDAGCDSFFADYTLDGSAISFGEPEARSELACSDEAASLQEAYLRALARVAGWRPFEGTLQLTADDGEVMLEFSEATAVISQRQLDAILAQLAALVTRVEALEQAEAGKGKTPAKKQPKTKPGKAPKAPKAKGSGKLVFALSDADPAQGRVQWRDRADDEDGYRLYARRVYCGLKPGVDPDEPLDTEDFTQVRSDFVRVGKAPADATEFRPVHQKVAAKLPPQPRPLYGSGEIYDLYVAAYNDAGESKRVPVGSYMTTPEWLCP